MDELSIIKVDLRGVLISCPQGMTIQRLERDYRELVGNSIPFSRMGFNRCEHFLRSLTDTLTVIFCYKSIVLHITKFFLDFRKWTVC